MGRKRSPSLLTHSWFTLSTKDSSFFCCSSIFLFPTSPSSRTNLWIRSSEAFSSCSFSSLSWKEQQKRWRISKVWRLTPGCQQVLFQELGHIILFCVFISLLQSRVNASLTIWECEFSNVKMSFFLQHLHVHTLYTSIMDIIFFAKEQRRCYVEGLTKTALPWYFLKWTQKLLSTRRQSDNNLCTTGVSCKLWQFNFSLQMACNTRHNLADIETASPTLNLDRYSNS